MAPAAEALDCTKRLDAQVEFMLVPVATEDIDLRRGATYTEVDLLRIFGIPQRIDSKGLSSDLLGWVIERQWTFDGLKVRATLLEQYWTDEIEVSTSRVGLKCGLRIGRPAADFIDRLGTPSVEHAGVLRFDLEYPDQDRGFELFKRYLSARLWLTVRQGRVERLRWVPGPGH